MQSTILALVAFGMLLAFVQCADNVRVAEFEIKEGLLTGGRSYEIKSKTNAAKHFTIRNELFEVAKKLILLEDGKERFTVKHDLTKLMSSWIIKDVTTGKEMGTIENSIKLIGSEINARGAFGNYKVVGNFGNHEFTITKDGEKVAKISKETYTIHDIYGLTVYGDVDQGLMVLFTVIVDEIREH